MSFIFLKMHFINSRYVVMYWICLYGDLKIIQIARVFRLVLWGNNIRIHLWLNNLRVLCFSFSRSWRTSDWIRHSWEGNLIDLFYLIPHPKSILKLLLNLAARCINLFYISCNIHRFLIRGIYCAECTGLICSLLGVFLIVFESFPYVHRSWKCPLSNRLNRISFERSPFLIFVTRKLLFVTFLYYLLRKLASFWLRRNRTSLL